MGAALGMLRQELDEKQRRRFDLHYPSVRRLDEVRRQLIAEAKRLVERKKPLNLAEKKSLREVVEDLQDTVNLIASLVRVRERG